MWKNLLILGILFLISCAKQGEYIPPTFPIEGKLKSISLSHAESVVAYPYGICVDESYIYLLALMDNKWIHVYDKENGDYMGGYVAHGEGPHEIVEGSTLYYDQKSGTIQIYDQVSARLVCYQIEKGENALSLTHLREVSFREHKGVTRKAWELSPQQQLAEGQIGTMGNELGRFQLLSDATVVDEYNSFPVAEVERMSYLEQKIAINKDEMKMAVGTLYGAILEIFDINKGIEKVETRLFYPPNITYQNGAIKNSTETVFGFTDIYATSDCIYAIWIGDKNPNAMSSVVLFDWNGKEIAKYGTETILLKICIDQENTIYAVAYSEEKGFYLVCLTQ